ncbi:oligodendrocyte-myelin glycoprotein [Pleurodeles waltl]|uniref:oligodendrocyte-myelin glycoprotein n=1 Tax=Pleurodeles waltl TaxID=8319 RepID=UPI003709B1EC
MECRKVKTTLSLLTILVSSSNVLGLCPFDCSCFAGSRHADCSDRNLSTLPQGLQDNITYLNLSHNRFFNLDHQLTRFTNLRTLDISHNLLSSIPSHLPRSLWELYAANNNIRMLHKHDTSHQWNLRLLDISKNRLERAVLINNTLISLRSLNLSSNKLWTVPTNLPYNIETVDLSNNFLTQILPNTLVRLPFLASLYLHSNRFTHIPNGSFEHLLQLQTITLHHNPWSCNTKQNITYLLEWTMETTAVVDGYPCPKQTLSRRNITLSPTMAEAQGTHILITGGAARGTTKYRSLADETTKATQLNDQIQDSTPSKASTFITCTVSSVLDEDGSAVESNVYVAATREPALIKESVIIDLSSHLGKQSSTIITLNIDGGKPTTLPGTSQQTVTTILVQKQPTISILNSNTPSSAIVHQHAAFNIILVNVVLFLASNMLAFSY